MPDPHSDAGKEFLRKIEANCARDFEGKLGTLPARQPLLAQLLKKVQLHITETAERVGAAVAGARTPAPPAPDPISDAFAGLGDMMSASASTPPQPQQEKAGSPTQPRQPTSPPQRSRQGTNSSQEIQELQQALRDTDRALQVGTRVAVASKRPGAMAPCV